MCNTVHLFGISHNDHGNMFGYFFELGDYCVAVRQRRKIHQHKIYGIFAEVSYGLSERG